MSLIPTTSYCSSSSKTKREPVSKEKCKAIQEEIARCIDHGLDNQETLHQVCTIYPEEMDDMSVLIGVIRDLMSGGSI